MPIDVFNNPSNDYVNPGLAPCANSSDEFDFKFLPRQEAGVVSGASIIQTMNLSDIVIPITSWIEEKKYISPGEVVYIPGLTKGLTYKTQRFPYTLSSIYTDQEFFMKLDISINYYSNFRYYNINKNSSSNYALNYDIENAVNINLSTSGIGVSMLYDASNFTFTGNSEGYDFSVSNAVLTLIDASMDSSSPFPSIIDASGVNTPQVFNLVVDSSNSIPAAKYPNGAMRGYMMKVYFPTTSGQTDRWLYMNNVKSPYTVYETVDVSGNTYWNQYSKIIDVGMNGAGNITTMSAGEYLDYINTYALWDKVGEFRAHISSEDPANSNITNLVGGFYIFNPHEFPVQVEYMLIN
jgi:hypothetical protein